ncbi:MAG TPA: hypothetical protein VGO16_03970 [Pseudonocardiaceae bacterium]|jgi:uncharacterized membrane protein|nr:hypothetical protein [Pseudonocardiaceae bacterium]
MHAPEPAHPHLPAWLRPTRGEHRWPAALAVAVAIGLQLVPSDRMVPQVRYLLLALEIALLVALVVANPFRINRESALLRTAGLTLTAFVGLSNGWSVVLLVLDLVDGGLRSPAELLTAGGAIWLTNVLAFALAYWELDRGGPAARAAATHAYPDFLFAQMQSPQLADPDWEPQFVDYLYLAFTNATAFSPTDVLPLSRWAKVTMMVQSAVALAVVVLVVARAVNVLG